MGKTRDLVKKIRDTKGIFHAKMGSIKGRNGMDLTEAGDIKKRWQEYMEELYKKDLHDPDNHDDVITNLEPWQLPFLTLHITLIFVVFFCPSLEYRLLKGWNFISRVAERKTVVE